MPARERGQLLFKFADIIEKNMGQSDLWSCCCCETVEAKEGCRRSARPPVRGRWRPVVPSASTVSSRCTSPSASAADALLLSAADEIVKLEASNSGKPAQWSRAELGASLQAIRFFAGAADKIAGTTIEVDDKSKSVITRREPIGVVGQVVPWCATRFSLIPSAPQTR